MAALEKGTIPWRKPWRSVADGAPRNLASKRAYRGINVFLLGLASPYAQPWWLTMKQANTLGGRIRKGEKSTIVVFCKQLNINAEPGDPAADEKGRKQIWMLRNYRVFNVEQLDGIPLEKIPAIEHPEQPERVGRCEEGIGAMPNAPEILHAGERAAYVPSRDVVYMPVAQAFKTPEAYWATLAHELVHSTSHETRLARDEIRKPNGGFGSDPYAREELVAEMGAGMLCAIAGIDTATIEATASYIANWLEKLRNDKKLLDSAASRLQAACDHIGGRTPATSKSPRRRSSPSSPRKPGSLPAACFGQILGSVAGLATDPLLHAFFD